MHDAQTTGLVYLTTLVVLYSLSETYLPGMHCGEQV